METSPALRTRALLLVLDASRRTPEMPGSIAVDVGEAGLMTAGR